MIKSKFIVCMHYYSPLGTKVHFSCFMCTSSWFFINMHTFKILNDCQVSVCVCELQCLSQESPLSFGTRKLVFFMAPHHLTTLPTSLQMLPVCFILCKQATLLKKMNWDSEQFVFIEFRCSRIELFVEMCTVLKENRLKC